MRILAFLLVFGAQWAHAVPLLRLGDMDLKKAAVGFKLSARGGNSMAITDEEALLLTNLAEALGPVGSRRLIRSLVKDGVRFVELGAAVDTLNARAERLLRRRLIAIEGDSLTLDPRPRAVPGVAFRPVEGGVIWREEWLDLTANQARFVGEVAARGEASYAELEGLGWPSRRARELVARMNARAGDRMLAVDYGRGVRLACGDALAAE